MRKTALLAAGLLALLSLPALAAEEWRHALSLIDTPQYPADFKHFSWVNPDAPKGGSVTMSDTEPYDTFNFLPAGANPPSGIGLIYQTLMEDSLDEPSTSYGLLAEAVKHPDDFSSVTYRLRKEARFEDGKPVTPEDVIWSFDKAKTINPFSGQYYADVVKAEKTGERDVTFSFKVKGNRELPYILGQVTVLPKHWWEGKDAKGKPRDISKATTEIPPGSGPYRIKSSEPGRAIVYERVKNHWTETLPVGKGMNNFDIVKYTTYSDPTVAFEAFKAGEVEFRVENSSRRWANDYGFKAIAAKAAVKEMYPLQIPQGMQGFFFNTRKAKFADKRVREAFDLVFDFEWSNKNLFFGQYTRSPSFFTNSEYAATGLPQGRELELLNEVKGKVPDEVFTKEYQNPVSGTDAALRDNTRKALGLLKDAGWEIKNGVLTNAKSGEPMKIEFIEIDDTYDRILNPYFQNLKRLGIEGKITRVDTAQYIDRVKSFNFDLITHVQGQSESPGNEQREFWSSAAADIQGSRNLIGIKDAAIDHLVDKIILAKNHDDLVAACRALDRVLLWNHFVVPNWYLPAARLAYWDKFRYPAKPPKRSPGFPTVWWYDAAAAAKVATIKVN